MEEFVPIDDDSLLASRPSCGSEIDHEKSETNERTPENRHRHLQDHSSYSRDSLACSILSQERSDFSFFLSPSGSSGNEENIFLIGRAMQDVDHNEEIASRFIQPLRGLSCCQISSQGARLRRDPGLWSQTPSGWCSIKLQRIGG